MNEISVIGLVGPSGVGKGFCKEIIKSLVTSELKEPIIATTRNRRVSDGKDRISGITKDELFRLVKEEKVIFPHQPFGPDGDWYGFVAKSLESPGNYLTEVHPDNVISFNKRFSQSLVLIGLIADRDYLFGNLVKRNTESSEELNRRLAAAIGEIERINNYYREGYINTVIPINDENRNNLSNILTPFVHGFLSGELFK